MSDELDEFTAQLNSAGDDKPQAPAGGPGKPGQPQLTPQ
jgi:hypothetical protein